MYIWDDNGFISRVRSWERVSRGKVGGSVGNRGDRQNGEDSNFTESERKWEKERENEWNARESGRERETLGEACERKQIIQNL